MSQHDYAIADQNGLAYLADLNAAMLAIVSQNSGAAQPSTMFAYQFWADTTTGWLKQRNAANSAWINVCKMSNFALHSVQLQSATAFTTAGSAPAYTVGTDPAVAIVSGMRLRLNFHAANNGAAATLNKDAGGAVGIKQYDAGGAKRDPYIYASMLADVEYDGTHWVLLTPIAGDPPGMVSFFAQSSAPSGYLKANGANVSRTTYAALFAAIGTTHGAGDGSTTFTLPDLRGEFIRGWDDSRGVDVARVFGSAQAQDLQPHSHGLGTQGSNTAGSSYASIMATTADRQSINPTASFGTTETRPRNVALLACIKF